MTISSFKKFLEEEDSKAIVQTGLNSVSVDDTLTREILNSRLANVTRKAFLTPYIALGNVARVLAYASIIIPQYTFLNRDEGEVVFDVNQFGKKIAKKIFGKPFDQTTEEDEPNYYVYFSYAMNDDGFYDCFATIVDSEGLEKILDMDDEIIDKVDAHQELEKPDEPKPSKISEASAPAPRPAPASGPNIRLPVAPADQFGKTKINPTGLMDPKTGNVTPIPGKKPDENSAPSPPPSPAPRPAPASGPDIRLPVAPADQFGKTKINPTGLMDPKTGDVTPVKEAKDHKMKKTKDKERQRIVLRLKDKMKLIKKEELKGNQHKLDVAEPKGKLTAADFKELRKNK